MNDASPTARGMLRATWPALSLAFGLFMHCASTRATADVLHDESIHGDLSNDRLVPTSYVLGVGVHSLLATSVQGDREYVSLTIPIGLQLSEIILISYDGLDGTAFIGVQEGAQFTEPPTGTNVANLLGYAHFGPDLSNVGLDILPEIAIGDGAIGFTGPLPASTYTFWIQQTGTNAATYQFDFVVIPGPGAIALLGMACALRTPRQRSL